jgi:GxxExxY protein
MNENEFSNKIIGAAIAAHSELGGPGLLESIYEEALCQELVHCGLRFVRQRKVPFVYKGNVVKSIHSLSLTPLSHSSILVGKNACLG